MKHEIGDLVYHRDTLGYIEDIDSSLYVNDSICHIRWLNPKMEDDVSTEWSLDVSKMKAKFFEEFSEWNIKLVI